MKISLFAFKEFRADPVTFFKKVFSDNDRFIPVSGGILNFLFVNDADAAQHVLQTHAKNYKKDFISLRSSTLLGKGLVTSEGELWKKQRKLIQPAFHQHNIERYSHVVREATLKLVAEWKQKLESVHPGVSSEIELDLHAEMVSLTLAIVVQSLFGSDIDQRLKEVSEALNAILQALHPKMNRLIDFPMWIPTPENLKLKIHLATIDSVIDEIILKRELHPEREYHDLLGSLLTQSMDRTQLRDELVTLFIAGHETTANVLSWSFYLLSKNPEHRDSVAIEWNQMAGDQAIEFEQLFALPHLKKVIQESMRLYPPVWMISRQAIADDEVSGIKIIKGTIVLLCSYVIHRNPDYWDQPNEFRPERFDARESADRPKFAYFPFGGGNRICIGSSFALMEAMMILGILTQNFEWDLKKGEEFYPKATVVLRPSSGPHVMLRRRAKCPTAYAETKPISIVI
jgi:cytochrome P450